MDIDENHKLCLHDDYTIRNLLRIFKRREHPQHTRQRGPHVEES